MIHQNALHFSAIRRSGFKLKLCPLLAGENSVELFIPLSLNFSIKMNIWTKCPNCPSGSEIPWCILLEDIYLPMGLKLMSLYHPSFLCLRFYSPNQIQINFQPLSVSYLQSIKTYMDLFCISFNVIIHCNYHCLTISLPEV